MFKKNSNKPVLGFICTSLNNVAGGLERQILRTCKELDDLGYKVFLISYDNENAKSFFKVPESVVWLKCGNGLIPHKRSSKIDRLKQILYLRKQIIRNSITHLITFHHGIFPRTFLATFLLGKKLIVSERNSLKNYDHIRLSKINIGFLSLIFAKKITVQLASYRNDYPFFVRERIKVIPNLIEKPLNSYKMPSLNSATVSMMGRLCAQKNFITVLEQINNTDYFPKNFKVKIAGEGDDRKLIENRFKNLINEKIFLLGNVSDCNKFLTGTSVFCFPSLWEGYPNALVEALRNGLPIVTTKRMAHLAKFVEHRINALIVPDEEILSALTFLLEDNSLLKKMSYESYKKYEILFKESTIKNWVNLIEELN